MDALKAEARRIEEEVEEFSSRTAKEVASIVTAISSIEDESHKMKKRVKCIDSEVETLINEKEGIKLSLAENDDRLRELRAKKNEMDEMVDIEMKKYKERDTEVKDILSRLSVSDPVQPSRASGGDSEMIGFLKQAIAEKEEDLICPICLEAAQTPIFTCPDSHLICSSCVPKLKAQECPQCRVALPHPLRRHRFAEKSAAELEKLRHEMAKLTGIDPQIESQNSKRSEEKEMDGQSDACSTEPEGQRKKTKGKRQRGVPLDLHVGDPRGKVFTQDDAFNLNRCGVEMCENQSLFVGNLPLGASEDQVAQTFEKYGRVTRVKINKDSKKWTRENKTSRPNFGFLEFDTEEAVHQALRSTPIRLFGHHDLFVEKIKLCWCKGRPGCHRLPCSLF